MSTKFIVVALLCGCALPPSEVEPESDSLAATAQEPLGAIGVQRRSGNLIHVTIDARALSTTERRNIHSLSVRVTGDMVPVVHTYPIGDELADGETRFPYYPGADHGVVLIRVGVNDVNGTELSSSERQLNLAAPKGIDVDTGRRSQDVTVALPATKR
jgi:hypothetical protein